MSLKDVKAKIKAVKKTGQVAKAMEAVSAAKMRKAQEWALSARPYSYLALKILKSISKDKDALKHHLISGEVQLHPQNPLFIVITSDRGLAGSLNSAVLRTLQKDIEESNYNKAQIRFISIGKKANDFLNNRGQNIIANFGAFPDSLPIEEVRAIKDIILKEFYANNSDGIYILYNNFISTFEQKPVLHQILPLVSSEIEEMLDSIRPKRGKYAELFYKDEETTSIALHQFEPNPEAVLESLLPFLVETIIFQGALETKASEHSARMVAMKSAGDKAKEVTKDLTRDYNKARQSIITREMSEIVGGIEALK